MFVFRRFCRILSAFMLLGCLAAVPAGAASSADISIVGSQELGDILAEEGKGKVIILTVFASWCAPCREEISLLKKIRAEVPADDIFIVAVSADHNLGDLKIFLARQNMNFPVYLGTQELLVDSLGVSGVPHMFLFNRSGEFEDDIVGLMPEADFRRMLKELLEAPGV